MRRTSRGRPIFLTMAFALLLILFLSLGAQTFRSEADYSVVNTFSIGCALYHDAINPQTKLIYALDYNCGKLYVVNATTGATVASVNAGSEPDGVAFNPLTNMIYVSNQESNTVSVINGMTYSVTATINVGSSAQAPGDIAVNPNTNEIFVVGSQGVLVINGSNNRVVGSIADNGSPSGIAIDSSKNMIYVANGNDSLTSINGTTDEITNTLKLGVSYGASGIAVDPITGIVYVTGLGGIDNYMHLANMLWEVSTMNDSVIGSTQLGSAGQFIALDTSTTVLYVVTNGQFIVVNGTNLSIMQNLSDIPLPMNGVVLDPASNNVYATFGLADGGGQQGNPSGVAVIATEATSTTSTLATSSTSGNSTTSPSETTTTSNLMSTTSLGNTTTSSSASQPNAPPPQSSNPSGGSFFTDSMIASVVVAAVVVGGIASYFARRHR